MSSIRPRNVAEYIQIFWRRKGTLFLSSPLLTTAAAKLISAVTDATLLVIRAGKTSSTQMARAILPLKQEDLIGVVLNRASR